MTSPSGSSRPERTFRNRLNNLSTKDWIKFQKSWFVHNPPRRKEQVLRHPAKFPETLAQQFIEFFTKRGQTVLDPMVGTGSTLIACLRSGRNGVGIEINPEYAELAARLIQEERDSLGAAVSGLSVQVLRGDAAELGRMSLRTFDYVLTSPPYWDMLHAKGFKTQAGRRADPDLDLTYSDDPADLGNIADYEEFLE